MDVQQIATFAALIAGLVAAYVNFRKAPADLETVNLSNLEKVNEGYRALNAELRIDLARKDEEIASLRKQIAGLRAEIEDLVDRVAGLEHP